MRIYLDLLHTVQLNSTGLDAYMQRGKKPEKARVWSHVKGIEIELLEPKVICPLPYSAFLFQFFILYISVGDVAVLNFNFGRCHNSFAWVSPFSMLW